VEEEPVAICRLKRVAADYKSDAILERVRLGRAASNGKRIITGIVQTLVRCRLPRGAASAAAGSRLRFRSCM
jgi:hypothetical protein